MNVEIIKIQIEIMQAAVILVEKKQLALNELLTITIMINLKNNFEDISLNSI